jgi:hypothetical protein
MGAELRWGTRRLLGFVKIFKNGMCVRIPIDVQRVDHNYRDFRIGKIEKIRRNY